MKPLHILFSGGGTLGPVTPLLAVSHVLREKTPDITMSWVGTFSGPEEKFVTKAGISFFAIHSGKLRRYFSWRNFIDPFFILYGCFEAWRLLGKLKPDVVVSAGGFVAVPVVWAAALRRIPVHIHQQDVRIGFANKLSQPFATSISVAFEQSLHKFPSEKTSWTGNPVRAEIMDGSREEGQRLFSLEKDTPTILILGGGTGAIGINQLVRDALPLLTSRVQILHITGPHKVWENTLSVSRYHQFPLLLAEMKHAYASADLVVTRTGMGSLTELAAFGIPSILIPMPHSHQEDNAAFFVSYGAGVLFDETTATPEDFVKTILTLLNDKAKLSALRGAMSYLTKKDAASSVAEKVLILAQKHRDEDGLDSNSKDLFATRK